jgi:streptogramin lyase
MTNRFGRRAAVLAGLALLSAYAGGGTGSAASNTCPPGQIGAIGAGGNGLTSGDGTTGCTIQIPVQAYDLTLDSLHNVWFTTPSGDVWELQSTNFQQGTYTPIFSSVNNPNAQPRQIAVTGKCTNYCFPYVYFTEFGASAIGRVTLLGGAGSSAINPVTSFPTPTPDAAPYGLAIDSHGNVWFAESGIRGPNDHTPPYAAIAVMFAQDNSIEECPLTNPQAQPMGVTVERRSDGDRIWFTENATGRVGVIVPKPGNECNMLEYDGLSANAGPLSIAVAPPKQNVLTPPPAVPSVQLPTGPAETDVYVTEVGLAGHPGSGQKIGRLTVANNVAAMPKVTAIREYLTGWTNPLTYKPATPFDIAVDQVGDVIYTLPNQAEYGILLNGEGIPQTQGQINYSGVIEVGTHNHPFTVGIDPTSHDLWFVSLGQKQLLMVQNIYALPSVPVPAQSSRYCPGL